MHESTQPTGRLLRAVPMAAYIRELQGSTCNVTEALHLGGAERGSYKCCQIVGHMLADTNGKTLKYLSMTSSLDKLNCAEHVSHGTRVGIPASRSV